MRSLYDAIKIDLATVETYLAAQKKRPSAKDLLFAATCADHADIRHYLVSLAAEKKIKVANGMNDAHAAAISGDLEHLKRAVKRNAELDRAFEDDNALFRGFTPLHFAAKHDNDAVAKALLDAGVDVDLHDHGSYSRTPLHVALEHGSEKTARVLIEAGAELNAKDRYGETPMFVLHSATRPGFLDFLVESGADLTLENEDGEGIGASLLAKNALEPLKYLAEHKGMPLTFKNGSNVLLASLCRYYGNHGFEDHDNFVANLDWILERVDINAVATVEDRQQNLLEVALADYSGVQLAELLLDRGATTHSGFDFALSGDDLAKKLTLLQGHGVSLPAGALASGLVRGLAMADDEDEISALKEMLTSFSQDPGFKDARTDDGVDLLFEYVSSLLYFPGPGRADVEVVDMLIAAGVPVDREYSDSSALSGMRYEGFDLPRQRYSVGTLLKDCETDVAELLLPRIEEITGPTKEVERGVGFGFDGDTSAVLIYGVRLSNQSSDQLIRLSKLAAATEGAAMVPATDLSRVDDNEYTHDAVVGVVVASADADGGVEQVAIVEVKSAANWLSEFDDEFWSAVGDIASAELDLDGANFFLMATGPLASAYLKLGVLGAEDDDGAGSFTPAVDTEQTPHDVGVWGETVASAEDWGVAELDDLPGTLAQLADGTHAYLIPRFD